MAQHALRRKDDERLAPRAQGLAAQHVKILRGRRGLANLQIVLGGQLQVALDARAGMLWALSFVAVREQKHEAAGQIPVVLRGAQELIDDHLRTVGEISKLRFPKNQRFRIVAAKAVFESDASRLGKRGVVNFAKSLLPGEMRERQVIVLGFRIDQNSVALIEGAALGVLPGQTD